MQHHSSSKKLSHRENPAGSAVLKMELGCEVRYYAREAFRKERNARKIIEKAESAVQKVKLGLSSVLLSIRHDVF
jgi:hypothetical protein